MEGDVETLGEALGAADFPTLINIGTALLSLTEKSAERGELDLEQPFSDTQDLQFKPGKLYRFNSIMHILRSYLPNPEWFDITKFKGLKRHQVVAAWTLLVNAFLSKKLLEVAKLRELQGDIRSRNAHQKGSAIIGALEYPIESGKQAQDIKGIGPKMAAKIDLLLTNGDLEELKVVESREAIIKLFSFWGSSTATALGWYEKGYRTIVDLVQADEHNEINLTKMQRLAISHLEDFEVVLTVEDANFIVKLVRASIPIGFEVILVGSFRRGRQTSKDCDILVIGDPKTSETCAQIAANLSQIADLEIASQGQHVFMGMIKMPSNVWKRVDVFVASEDERGCALLAHTGPAQYNIRMRAAAQERNWTLNERHVIDEHGEVIATPTEADVQKLLGFAIQTPQDRK
jgi:DNA polymerase/3'-5' exonuclease PolX